MVVAMMEMSRRTEVVMALVAIALLAMATFGFDSALFSKKRKAGRDPRAPKRRVSYVVEDAEEDAEEGR